jgi:small GTP-binding protein
MSYGEEKTTMYLDFLKKIKDELGIEFKVYNSVEEKQNSTLSPYEIVFNGDTIEHLTILKNAEDLATYFINFLNVKSLAFFSASARFDINCLRCFRNLTVLDISYNNLTELPDFIRELSGLTSLNIRNTTLTELPVFIKEMKNLKALNLGGNNLTELPTCIGELKKLTSLDISYNSLTYLPDFIGELSGLVSLNVGYNSLTNLPDCIGELKKLTTIDISYNKLTNLPNFIGELENLMLFNLGGNSLAEMPSFIGKLKNLTSLNVGNSNLTELPIFIRELENLTSLDVGGNKLTELPDFIGELKNLASLNIGYNKLSELPPFIGKLTNLKSLDISYIELMELPASIGELKNLTSLRASYNNLKELPDFIRTLKKLVYLDVSDNDLTELPDFTEELTNLTSLDVSYNNISELPCFIGKLKNLTFLDISYNKFKELPIFLGDLKNLLRLDISGLTLNYIPKNVVTLGIPFNKNYKHFFINMANTKLIKMDTSLFEQPYDVVKQFYEAKLVELKECKLIVLGDGQSGKTCLIERLTEETFHEGSPTTDGIISKDWSMTFSENDETKIKVLDFGGQEVMHSMHTCFLTSRTVYLVVLDGRLDNLIDSRARYWMENINTFAPNSPVIMIISKVDPNGNLNAALNSRDLHDNYPNLSCVEKVSAKTGYNIPCLKNHIQSVIENSSGYKYYFNSDWMNIKNEIENMKDDYIKDTVYDNICEKHGLRDDYFKESLLKWFKDLGIAYYYKSDDFCPSNEKYRVLNPAWLTNGIYTLILKAPSNTGLLLHNEIRETLRENTMNNLSAKYLDEEIEFILYVMRQYEISLKVGNTEFIPSKLDKEKPKFEFDKEKALHISWKGRYIPNIVLHRLMVRKYDKINTACMWRTGAIFSDGNEQCKYQVLIEKDDEQIDLYVLSSFEEPRIYLQSFRESINEALKQIAGVEEFIYYNINGKQGREPYDDVLTQFVKFPNDSIYLSDIKDRVMPQAILKQVFTDDFIEEEKETGTKIKFDFRGANINGSVNVSQNGNITHIGDVISQQAEIIKNTRGISDEKLSQLFECFKEMAKNDNIKEEVKAELVETISKMQRSNKSKWWQHIQNFLSNSANLANIISLGFIVADFFK